MDQHQLYDEIVLSFPPTSPMQPEWTWENVHDGLRLKKNVLAKLIADLLDSAEVIVLVHSTPGTATRLPFLDAVDFLERSVLVHEIQVSDPHFTRFVVVNKHGLAARIA